MKCEYGVLREKEVTPQLTVVPAPSLDEAFERI
jgi:hypothetical protein